MYFKSRETDFGLAVAVVVIIAFGAAIVFCVNVKSSRSDEDFFFFEERQK